MRNMEMRLMGFSRSETKGEIHPPSLFSFFTSATDVSRSCRGFCWFFFFGAHFDVVLIEQI